MSLAEAGRLRVAEDFEFQKASWRWQRAGWVLIGLVIAAALAGVIGSGPLSSTVRASPGGRLSVEYERFVHRQAPTAVRIGYGAQSAREGKVRLSLTSAYVGKLKIEHVHPQPEKVEIGGGRLTYVFPADDSPGEVVFAIQLEGFGPVAGEVALDGERVALAQFAYP